jgi:hypothetical protein
MSNGWSKRPMETRPGLRGRQGIWTEDFLCDCLPVIGVLDVVHIDAAWLDSWNEMLHFEWNILYHQREILDSFSDWRCRQGRRLRYRMSHRTMSISTSTAWNWFRPLYFFKLSQNSHYWLHYIAGVSASSAVSNNGPLRQYFTWLRR